MSAGSQMKKMLVSLIYPTRFCCTLAMCSYPPHFGGNTITRFDEQVSINITTLIWRRDFRSSNWGIRRISWPPVASSWAASQSTRAMTTGAWLPTPTRSQGSGKVTTCRPTGQLIARKCWKGLTPTNMTKNSTTGLTQRYFRSIHPKVKRKYNNCGRKLWSWRGLDK